MRSQGTKETQGINGDAAALQRQIDAAIKVGGAAVGAPCPYEDHRDTDWVTPTSQVICGVCHTPAMEFPGIVRRGDLGFEQLAAAAAARVSSVPCCLTCGGRLTAAEGRAGEIYCAGCAGQRLPGDEAAVAIAEHEISLERRGLRSAEDLEHELDQAFDVAVGADA